MGKVAAGSVRILVGGLLAAGGSACGAAGEASTQAAATVDGRAPAEAVDTLPLKRGFYVRTDAECSEASHATLALVRRDGITACEFVRLERIGEARYRAEERCTDPRESYELTQEYEVLADDRYRLTFEYGETVEFRHCAQSRLPDPWRDNDISDLVE